MSSLSKTSTDPSLAVTPVAVFVMVVIVVGSNNMPGRLAVVVVLTIHQEQLSYMLLIEDLVIS